MPRSFTMFTFFTLFPVALSNSETDQPKRLLRMWPRCNGLLVLGEEYSTSTGFMVEPGADCFIPNDSSDNADRKFSSQLSSFKTKLRKPFTTLKSRTTGQFNLRCSPTALPVSS